LKKKVSLIGNFGVPVTDCVADEHDYVIIEMSSYQTANFEGNCLIGLVTSLYPEHLDWHQTLQQYYIDKMRVLEGCQYRLVATQVRDIAEDQGIQIGFLDCFDMANVCRHDDGSVFCDKMEIGELSNSFLRREHNRSNVCGVLRIIKVLGLSLGEALQAMASYKGLPHRQQELGYINGILYVDDSISTTPQSSVAALKAYAGQNITLIAGGKDRGIDLLPLSTYLEQEPDIQIILMGETGKKLSSDMFPVLRDRAHLVASMKEAVALAREVTPDGGVVLLSPASPSHDMFKNFIEKGDVFAKEAGF
jgi:UDP-N-acetylmuramoylalanine--D-glutamate ligase